MFGDASTQHCAEQLVQVVGGLPLVPGHVVQGVLDGNIVLADHYLMVLYEAEPPPRYIWIITV